MKRGFAVLLFACIILASCATQVIPPTPSTTPTLPMGQEPVPGADLPHMSVETLQKRLQAGEAIVVVDVRAAEQYAAEHMAGALSIPEADFPARVDEVPKDKLIVFYCT